MGGWIGGRVDVGVRGGVGFGFVAWGVERDGCWVLGVGCRVLGVGCGVLVSLVVCRGAGVHARVRAPGGDGVGGVVLAKWPRAKSVWWCDGWGWGVMTFGMRGWWCWAHPKGALRTGTFAGSGWIDICPSIAHCSHSS